MSIWIVFAIYLLLNATGLLLIKLGTETSTFAIENSIFNLQLSFRLICGFILYVFSFLLSVFLISRIKLTVFYPTSIGVLLVITSILGLLVFKENLGVAQIIGMVLILAGVIIINLN